MKLQVGLIGMFWWIQLPLFGQMLTGNVMVGQDQKYLEEVTLVNLSSKDSTISDERGLFRIKVAAGDSVKFSKEGYHSKIIRVDGPDHILVTLYIDAVLLPTAYVYGKREGSWNMAFPNMSMYGSLSDRPAGPGKIYSGHSESATAMTPGFTMDGPISYFTRYERRKRQYRKKLEFAERQSDYLELIRSDSVKRALIRRFDLEEEELDSLIVEFNVYHRDHQFLDMDKRTVSRLLLTFINHHADRMK